jgi:hypothetical protein
MGSFDKLWRATGYATEHLGADVRSQLEGLLTRESIAMMAGFAVLFVAAQLTPVGWVADGIALTTITISAIFVGRVIFDVTQDLYRFFAAVAATSDRDLRAAGEALSRAIAAGGVAVVMALLTRTLGRRGGGGRPYEGPPPPGYVEALTAEGVLIRMPAAAVQEAAAASSVLQQAATYAVAAQPPGSDQSSIERGRRAEGPHSGPSPGRGPEVFEEISREMALDPSTADAAPADAAAAAADARAAGLVGPRGTPGSVDLAVQEHAAAPEVRAEYGVSGKDVQSGHIGPTSFLRDLAGYSRGKADTTLLDRNVHAAFDRPWKEWAVAQRRAGRTSVYVSELYAVMLDAIDGIPGIAQRMKNAMAWRLQLELFRDLGLQPGESVELPYSNIKPGP